MSRVTRRSASSAPTGCQYTPSAVMVTSGTKSARLIATPSLAVPRKAIRRMTRSAAAIFSSSRNWRKPSASSSVETVAASRTRKPSARARSIPSRVRAHVPGPRWRSCSSGVALSRLICRTIRSRGNACRLSARRPVNNIPLVSTVVGATAAHASRMWPISSSRNGSPPVTKISSTPSCAASRAIRCTRASPSSRRGTVGDERTQQ